MLIAFLRLLFCFEESRGEGSEIRVRPQRLGKISQQNLRFLRPDCLPVARLVQKSKGTFPLKVLRKQNLLEGSYLFDFVHVYFATKAFRA